MSLYSTTRRNFLRGLTGSVVAGSFIIANPKVVLGDLLIPDPEPKLLQVTEPVFKIQGKSGALVKRVALTMEHPSYATMEIELLLGPDTRPEDYDILPDDEIHFVVVKQSDMRFRR